MSSRIVVVGFFSPASRQDNPAVQTAFDEPWFGLQGKRCDTNPLMAALVNLATISFGGKKPKKLTGWAVTKIKPICTFRDLQLYLTLPDQKVSALRALLGVGKWEQGREVPLTRDQVARALEWVHGQVGSRALKKAVRDLGAGRTGKTRPTQYQTYLLRDRKLAGLVSLDPFAGPRQHNGGRLAPLLGSRGRESGSKGSR